MSGKCPSMIPVRRSRSHIAALPDIEVRRVNAGRFLNTTQLIDADAPGKLPCSGEFSRCRRFCVATNNRLTGITNYMQIFCEFVFSGSRKLSRAISLEHLYRATASSMRKLILAVSTMMLGVAGPALAHAVLVSTVPPVRGSISGPDVVFRLQFNSRIDAARSTLKLVLPDTKVRSLVMEPQPSPDILTARSTDLKPGSYTLRWQVLAADGHITRGEVPFAVR